MINDMHLDFSFCMFCGETFIQPYKRKTKHHSIPQTLKPKFNITVPVCEPCHRKINGLYATSAPKKLKLKEPELKTLLNNVEGALSSYKRAQIKLEKVLLEHKDQVTKYENQMNEEKEKEK